MRQQTVSEFFTGQLVLDNETKPLPSLAAIKKVVLRLVSGSVAIVGGFALTTKPTEILIDNSDKIQVIGTGTIAFLVA